MPINIPPEPAVAPPAPALVGQRYPGEPAQPGELGGLVDRSAWSDRFGGVRSHSGGRRNRHGRDRDQGGQNGSEPDALGVLLAGVRPGRRAGVSLCAEPGARVCRDVSRGLNGHAVERRLRGQPGLCPAPRSGARSLLVAYPAEVRRGQIERSTGRGAGAVADRCGVPARETDSQEAARRRREARLAARTQRASGGWFFSGAGNSASAPTCCRTTRSARHWPMPQSAKRAYGCSSTTPRSPSIRIIWSAALGRSRSDLRVARRGGLPDCSRSRNFVIRQLEHRITDHRIRITPVSAKRYETGLQLGRRPHVDSQVVSGIWAARFGHADRGLVSGFP